MKASLLTVLMLACGNAMASHYTITKSTNPGPANVRPNSTALSVFSMRFADLPKDSHGKPKKIEVIEWRTTHYPKTGITEEVEICYLPRGAGVNRPELCEPISPDAKGDAKTFRSQPFSFESRIIIRHRFSGPRTTVNPVGLDHVVIRFSY